MTVLIETLGRPPAAARTTPSGNAAPRPHREPPPPLYKPREPIYPKLVHGPYRALKWGLMVVMLGIYYGVPWIRWPRPAPAPQQAVNRARL